MVNVLANYKFMSQVFVSLLIEFKFSLNGLNPWLNEFMVQEHTQIELKVCVLKLIELMVQIHANCVYGLSACKLSLCMVQVLTNKFYGSNLRLLGLWFKSSYWAVHISRDAKILQRGRLPLSDSL